jgi:hypothetical protein
MKRKPSHYLKNELIWILTYRGFGSEIINLIYAKNYSNHKNLEFGVYSTFWNFKYKKGLGDYFMVQEQVNKNVHFLLFLYQKFIFSLTFYYREVDFFNLFEDVKKQFIGENIDEYRFRKDLLSYSFKNVKTLFNVKSKTMYEVFKEVRDFNYHQRSLDNEAFTIKMNELLLDFWKFNPETLNEINERKIQFGILELGSYAVFHIRRGDKVAIATKEDRVYEVEEYINRLDVLAPSIRKVFIMTDDYQVFLELEDKYRNFDFFTLSSSQSKGHDQAVFNYSSSEYKRNHAIDLLTELEIARKSEIFIGSRGSNLFHLIEYFKIKGCHDLGDNVDIF